MIETVNWGIVATGNIAHQFADGLKILEDAKIWSVVSRTAENADKFAAEYDIPNAYTSMSDFLADEKLDVVYIATPHNFHKVAAIECLKAGKHVLCEKPMGLNESEVLEMIRVAKENQVLLVEAMWTHFFPAVIKLKALIEEGAIGKVKMIKSDFCFKSAWEPEARKLNKNLAGGALLDVGVYNIFLAQMLMDQEPVAIRGEASIGVTGVDEQNIVQLRYEDGTLAVSTSAVQTETLQDAYVYGDEGYIHVPRFWQSDQLILHKDGVAKEFVFERLGNGYSFEAKEVHRLLNEEAKECERVPLYRSLQVVRIMDELRRQWSLVYPGE